MWHFFLITAQFVFASALVLSTRWLPLPWFAIVLSLPGIAIAIAAWWTMGIRRLRIHPTTNEKTVLLQTGPYGWVRHPMYSGLLWFAGVLVLAQPSVGRVAMWIGLTVVLTLKAVIEERFMSEQFPDYKDYCRRVPRFLPWFARRA